MRWFKPFGVLFLPVSFVGVLVTLLAATVCVAVFLRVDARSHSASDTIDGVAPIWIAMAAVWWAIAMATSRTRPREP
jgi:hypothetical protein